MRPASTGVDEGGSPVGPTLPRHVDVLIVGAGYMGRWLAWFLTRPGSGGAPPEVLVVERDPFTYGASSRNAGFLTCGHASEMVADATDVGLAAVTESFLRRRRGMALVRKAFPDLVGDAGGSVDLDPITDEGLDLVSHLDREADEEIFSVREVWAPGREVRGVEGVRGEGVSVGGA